MNFLKFTYYMCKRHPDDFRMVMCIYTIMSIIVAIRLSHDWLQLFSTFILEMIVSMTIGMIGLFSFYIVMTNDSDLK